MDAETFRRFFVYSMALHDIGKFARSFQTLANLPGVDLVSPDTRYFYSRKHDALGLLFWEHARTWLSADGGCGLDAGALGNAERRSLSLWFDVIFGHHGKPVDQEADGRLEEAFKPEDVAAAWSYMRDAAALFEPVWPLQNLSDKSWRKHVLAPESWQLAGLAVLVDWLGSDQRVFGYLHEPMSLSDYWYQRALPAAERVLARSGLDAPVQVAPYSGFRCTYGFTPTPLQSWAETVPVVDEPQFFLLEDLTGSGKTEAALTLAHRLMEAGLGDGLYFALPTMATSNGMYERIRSVHETWFQADSRPSLVLAHGARELNTQFNQSILPEPPLDQPYDAADPGGIQQWSRWLADGRKKALLADVGVGTVDQALLGLLPRKHQSLRLYGLAGKILVLDEVHAYDTYTGDLLQRLLRAHAQQGGSVILLSATIPQALRAELAAAWRNGRGDQAAVSLDAESFPLATSVRTGAVDEAPLEAREGSGRDLPVTFVHHESEAIAALTGAARSGQCACWIRNTVDEAVAGYQAVVEQLDDASGVQLFHARFVMGDRQRLEQQALTTFGKSSDSTQRSGAILVATQVVEQSLDLDFDVLVTDLAPVDLLIQRAGRLHRHARDESGNRLEGTQRDRRQTPVLHVLAPEWTEEPDARWLSRSLRGTSYVYPDTAKLWLTCRALRESGAIRLPEEARHLLEAVYAPEAVVPEGLMDAAGEATAARQVHRAAAGFNALALDRGYCQDSAEGQWDDDDEIGTRLSDEPTSAVVVLRETANSGIEPCFADAAHPWAMSTVQLRQSLASRIPELPEHHQQKAEQWRRDQPALKFARFWLPAGSQDEAVIYDPITGVTNLMASTNR
ncbi:MAG: CRISPR-associated helicase Cas3' [Spiribacter salinus]|uniref:CRISPR-associated helicase Cas3 n=1 Tax=Spiribacter salinus TaxID=1335746 RepID=A0A540VQK5_9GAMM|nr:MAG: CRISPR-associated helicase Cas3' [Spiribacter salinus]